MHALHADDGVASEVNRPRFSRHIQGLQLAVCCLSPRQLLADSCLFSTEGMIDNARIQEAYHSYAALNYLQTDNVLTSEKSRIRFHRAP